MTPIQPQVLEERLFGVKYWAYWMMHKKPNYEVYEYVGRSEDKLFYYFRHRKGDFMVIKVFAQLNAHGFRPFVLDIRQAEAWLDQNEKR